MNEEHSTVEYNRVEYKIRVEDNRKEYNTQYCTVFTVLAE